MDMLRFFIAAIITVPLSIMFFAFSKRPKTKKERVIEWAQRTGHTVQGRLVARRDETPPLAMYMENIHEHRFRHSSIWKCVYEYEIAGKRGRHSLYIADFDPPETITLYYRDHDIFDTISNYSPSNAHDIIAVTKNGAWGQVGYSLLGLAFFGIIYWLAGLIIPG